MSDLKKGEKLASRAILLEGVLAGLKVVIGVLSGSAVLISDAIHSVSDISSIITSWFGLRLAQRKPDEKFPYGYYKAENLGTLIISLLILYAGSQMIFSAWQHLFQFSSIRLPYLALGISLVDAVILYFFGQREIEVGQEIEAQSLIAMGKENKTHIFSSSAVLLGTLAAIYKIPYLEGLITFAIAGLIIKIGLEALKESVFSLMDVSAPDEKQEKVKQILANFPGVEDYSNLRLRRAGPYILGEVSVGVRRGLDLPRSQALARKIADKVKEETKGVEKFSVQVNAFEDEFHHLVLPVEQKDFSSAVLAKNFARPRYFLFINLEGEKIKGHYFIENPYKDKKNRAGLAVAKMISNQKSDTIIVRQIGEIAFAALQNNLFDIYQSPRDNVGKVIEKFNNGQLEKISQATKQVT